VTNDSDRTFSDIADAPTRTFGPAAGEPPPVGTFTLQPGQQFGPFAIVRPLGAGGMGEVYEAEELESGRHVALKVLTRSLATVDRARFIREGRLAAGISHPHTIYIYGTDEIQGLPVIAMELAPGGTLKDVVKQRGSLPPAQAVDAILQVVSGLEAAADAGVLHRDIKPSNCFVDADGTVKVGDFGLSISTLTTDERSLTMLGRNLFSGCDSLLSAPRPLAVRRDERASADHAGVAADAASPTIGSFGDSSRVERDSDALPREAVCRSVRELRRSSRGARAVLFRRAAAGKSRGPVHRRCGRQHDPVDAGISGAHLVVESIHSRTARGHGGVLAPDLGPGYFLLRRPGGPLGSLARKAAVRIARDR
jgi:serine/threonine protein kinase